MSLAKLEFDRLTAEAEIRERAYRQSHRDDPCEKCGAIEDVQITLTGSAGRLTALCLNCSERLGAVTAAFHNGFDYGVLHERAKPWWRRLFQ